MRTLLTQDAQVHEDSLSHCSWSTSPINATDKHDTGGFVSSFHEAIRFAISCVTTGESKK